MEISFGRTGHKDKETGYMEFTEKAKSLIMGETDAVSVLANMSAALKETFGFFWVGFYIAKGEELVLGPFQGGVACYRIKKGRGVCGKAWEWGHAVVVEDVDKFPGHIACSSLSRSEIVVPVTYGERVVGVIDVDSDQTGAFDDTDRTWLERIGEMLAEMMETLSVEHGR